MRRYVKEGRPSLVQAEDNQSNSLIVLSDKNHREALKPCRLGKHSKAYLLHLREEEQEKYILRGNILYEGETPLNKVELGSLVCDLNINYPIKNNLLIYGLFSYLYEKEDLRNKDTWFIKVVDIERYFGVSTGKKGYHLVNKLFDFQDIFGVIEDKVYPLLIIEDYTKTHIILKSPYMHELMKDILEGISLEGQEKSIYYTTVIDKSILKEKNELAALMTIELAILTVVTKEPHIAYGNLISKVPRLRQKVEGLESTSQQNRILKRCFLKVYELLEDRTQLVMKYPYMTISSCIPTVYELDKSIKIKKWGK